MGETPGAEKVVVEDALVPLVRRDLLEKLRRALGDGHSVLLTGHFGAGKTRLLQELANGQPTPVPILQCSFAGPDAFDEFLGVSGLGADELASAIASELADASMLLVDDAHLLSAEQFRVLELLLGAFQLPVVLTAPPGFRIRVAKLLQDGLLRSAELAPLDSGQSRQLISALFDPSVIEREAVEKLEELTGGVPLLIVECVRELRRSGVIQLVDDVAVWHEGVPARVLLGTVLPQLKRHFGGQAWSLAEVLALGGSLPVQLLERIGDEQAVHELRASGIFREISVGDREYISFAQAAWAVAIRSEVGRARANEVWRLLHEEASVSSWMTWPADRQAQHVILADSCGQCPPIELVLAVLRASVFVDRPATLAAADLLITHGEATAAQRLEALAVRARQHSWSGDSASARTDINQGREVSAASGLVQLEFEVASASLQATFGQDPVGAAKELTLTAVEQPAISSQLRAHAAAILGYGGHAKDSYRAATGLIAGGDPKSLLALAAPTISILAQRGEHDAARSLAERMFLGSMQQADRSSTVPGEVLAAAIFAVQISGNLDQVEATYADVRAAIDESPAENPPHETSLELVGQGMLLAARGRWAESVEAFRPPAARYLSHDPVGFGGLVQAWFARSLAAAGHVEQAKAALREGYYRRDKGVSALVSRYCEVLLLHTRLWLGEEIAEQAIELADEARDQELALVELLALHAATLARPTAVVDGLIPRANSLAAGMSAPIGAALAAHVEELSSDPGQFFGMAGRSLARYGWFIPMRVSADVLTAREREIATMAALGYSSKAVAERFVLSKRTVDAHLNRVYAKLNIAGREDLEGALGLG